LFSFLASLPILFAAGCLITLVTALVLGFGFGSDVVGLVLPAAVAAAGSGNHTVFSHQWPWKEQVIDLETEYYSKYCFLYS
jgi:hypothetical protein